MEESTVTQVDTPATQQTQPTVNVDDIVTRAQAKAEEAAQRKMESVFKSMLEQQGLDSEAITKMTQEWKSKQVTPEKLAEQAAKDLETEKAKNEALTRQILAISKGVPADKSGRYLKLAESYMDDKTGFEAALDLALKDFPTEKPAVYSAGAGSNPMVEEKDPFAEKLAKYRRK